jgi:hypothetical protein
MVSYMSAWILILIFANSNGSVAATNMEFPTQDGCVEASKQIKSQSKYANVQGFCVEKK